MKSERKTAGESGAVRTRIDMPQASKFGRYLFSNQRLWAGGHALSPYRSSLSTSEHCSWPDLVWSLNRW